MAPLRTQRSRLGPACARGLAILSVAFLLGGCASGTGLNKEGTKTPSPTVTLTMVVPDGSTPDTDYFVSQVAALAHGQLRVVVVASYPGTDPANEGRLAVALREGKVEMAVIPSRAWELDGERVLAFRALQAPFLISSYPLQRTVIRSAVALQILATLNKNGLVGLGFIPDQLRRPLGRHPFVSVADFRGARFRVLESPASAMELKALGATPLSDFGPKQVGTVLAQGRLDGVESSLLDIDNSDYVPTAKYLSANVVLFSKTLTIAISERMFDRLSAPDRTALRRAADATAAHADPSAAEPAELRRLCAEGLQVVNATPSELAGLQRAVAPVYAKLEQDPATKRAILGIERLKEHIPSGASLPSCGAMHAFRSGLATEPFPYGTYQSVLTPAEVAKAGLPAIDAHTDTFTWGKNGIWHDVWTRPLNPEQPPASGPFTVHGDLVTMGPSDVDFVMRWSYFRGYLTLRIVNVPDQLGDFIFPTNPWRKIS